MANWLSRRLMSDPPEEQTSDMAQIVETKIKKKSTSDKHFEWAKSELDANEKGYKTKRLSIILELARRLEEEGEIETGRTSTEIAKRLRMYVTQRYVNKVLDEKYKDVKHVESVKSRRTSSAKTKQAVQNADALEADIVAKYEQQPQKQEATRKESVKHYKQDELIFENSELKEALRRQTPLLRADQISANEITFIVLREKFNQLNKAMKNSRDAIRLVFDKSGILERAESDVF